MLTITVIARIAPDKDFFEDVLDVAARLVQDGRKAFHLYFMGQVFDQALFARLKESVRIGNLAEFVTFTEKSVRIKEVPDILKEGYFMGFSVGNFIGYSGIESLRTGYKSVFYNVDKDLENDTNEYPFSFAMNKQELFSILGALISGYPAYELDLRRENDILVKEAYLNDADKDFLLSCVS